MDAKPTKEHVEAASKFVLEMAGHGNRVDIENLAAFLAARDQEVVRPYKDIIDRAIKQTMCADVWKQWGDSRASVYNDALKKIRAILNTPMSSPASQPEQEKALKTIGDLCHRCRNGEKAKRGQKDWFHGLGISCPASYLRDLHLGSKPTIDV